MVSAVPIQLMSDHIFLGASVVAILSAEIVLLRANAHLQRKPLLAQLLGTSGGRPLHACGLSMYISGRTTSFLGPQWRPSCQQRQDFVLLHINSCTLRGSLRLLSFGQVGASLYALLAYMPCCLWNKCSGS